MLIDDIRNGENDQLEFKEVPNRDSARWLKTVVAFANGRGGGIVFGVSNARQVVGLKGDLFTMKDAIAYMNIIEDWGSGIPRIRADIKDAGLRDLEISTWPNAVRTVVYRQLPPKGGGKVGGVDIKQRIVRHIRETPRITIPAIVAAIGGGKRTIERAVAELKAEGVIRRNGSARNGCWEVVK